MATSIFEYDPNDRLYPTAYSSANEGLGNWTQLNTSTGNLDNRGYLVTNPSPLVGTYAFAFETRSGDQFGNTASGERAACANYASADRLEEGQIYTWYITEYFPTNWQWCPPSGTGASWNISGQTHGADKPWTGEPSAGGTEISSYNLIAASPPVNLLHTSTTHNLDVQGGILLRRDNQKGRVSQPSKDLPGGHFKGKWIEYIITMYLHATYRGWTQVHRRIQANGETTFSSLLTPVGSAPGNLDSTSSNLGWVNSDGRWYAPNCYRYNPEGGSGAETPSSGTRPWPLPIYIAHGWYRNKYGKSTGPGVRTPTAEFTAASDLTQIFYTGRQAVHQGTGANESAKVADVFAASLAFANESTTEPPPDPPPSGSSAFTPGGVSSGSVDGPELVLSHTVVSGTDRALVVCVSPRSTTAITSVTYGGTALTRIANSNGESTLNAEIWLLINPPAGTDDIVITPASSMKVVAVAQDYAGVHQTVSYGTPLEHSTSANAFTASPTSAEGDLIVGCLAFKYASGRSITPTAGQTEVAEVNYNVAGTGQILSMSYEPADASPAVTTTHSYAVGGTAGDVGRMLAIPLYPSDVTVAPVTFIGAVPALDSLTLLWDNPVVFDSIRVRSSTTDYPATVVDGTGVYNGTGETVTVSSLSSGTNYYLSIFTEDGGLYSQPVNVLVTTSEVIPTPTVPDATDFSASADDTFVTLTWTNPEEEFGTTVLVRKTGGYPSSHTDGTVLLSGGGTTYLDTGLTNDTQYYYKLYMETAGTYSTGVTATATPTAPPAPTIPTPPTGARYRAFSPRRRRSHRPRRRA